MKEYSIHGGKKGNERLAILSRTVGATTGGFLDHHQSVLSGRCLDLGCGGGTVTLNIAKRLQGKGEINGLDMDPVNISLAREAAHDQRAFRCRMVHGSMDSTLIVFRFYKAPPSYIQELMEDIRYPEKIDTLCGHAQ